MRPQTRIELIAGALIRERVNAILDASSASDEVSVIIGITPRAQDAKRVIDARGAPSRPGPADPTSPTTKGTA